MILYLYYFKFHCYLCYTGWCWACCLSQEGQGTSWVIIRTPEVDVESWESNRHQAFQRHVGQFVVQQVRDMYSWGVVASNAKADSAITSFLSKAVNPSRGEIVFRGQSFLTCPYLWGILDPIKPELSLQRQMTKVEQFYWKHIEKTWESHDACKFQCKRGGQWPETRWIHSNHHNNEQQTLLFCLFSLCLHWRSKAWCLQTCCFTVQLSHPKRRTENSKLFWSLLLAVCQFFFLSFFCVLKSPVFRVYFLSFRTE